MSDVVPQLGLIRLRGLESSLLVGPTKIQMSGDLSHSVFQRVKITPEVELN